MPKGTLRRWESAAKLEPYYAVINQPRFLSDRVSESRPAFFDSGEDEVASLLTLIREHLGEADIRNVLEFGCGPGRLLPAFARRGFRVTGVDLSPAMLAVARANAERLGASGVALLELHEFAAGHTTYDLINVSRVLQHIPPRDGVQSLQRLTQRLSERGLLHLNVPFRSTRPWKSEALLRLRDAVPPLNRVANALRGRPSRLPLLPTHVYDLDEVLVALHEGHCEIVSMRVTAENELTTAHVLAQKKATTRAAAAPAALRSAPAAQETTVPDDYLDPRTLIESVGLDALNARAEAYFQSTDNWDQQTGKPFSSITDAPSMLISLGVLLHGARLVPGMSVLDFGGGTGWLSRALMQLGCDVTLCDVSATALKIAQEFVQRNPPIGDNAGKLNVALFDGHTIPVASEQFDRIICFDSFHHVPNVPNVLAEFVRVLRPGGVAAFSEPGPEHSRSPQSQYEMRMYGVLENDVDVHAIWTTANALGFDDIRLAPFDVAPAFIRLPQFDDFLAHGESLQTAARHLRDYAANVRTFVLKKAGVERVDSRTATGLRAEIRVTVESTPAANEPTRARATVKNTGTHIWLPSAQKRGGVSLAAHLYQDGAIVDFDFLWLSLSDSEIGPNEEVSVDAVLPALGAGHYVLEFDCVANGVTWFAQVGSRVATVELTVR